MDLVDWPRVHRRALKDAPHTFAELRKELIRHAFWHAPIDARAEFHARRKGRSGLQAAAVTRLQKSIGAAHPARDGRQTPYQGNIIYYAQHAVACCCRTCLEYWHAIPKGRELTPQEIQYLADLISLFIDDRLPNLAEEPERLPRSVKLFEARGLRWTT